MKKNQKKKVFQFNALFFFQPMHILAFLVLFGLPACVPGEDVSPAEKKTTIVFFGDSITYAGGLPGGYVNLVAEAITEFNKQVEVIAAGVPGHKVTDLEYRLEGEVLARRPAIVVVYIGINDVWHSSRGQGTTPEIFARSLAALLRAIRAAGAEALLCTPSVIGENLDGSNEFDAMLDQFAEIARRTARENSVRLVDLRREFIAFLKKNNPDDLQQGILTVDGVHLNEAGNRLVAELMLAALKPVLSIQRLQTAD